MWNTRNAEFGTFKKDSIDPLGLKGLARQRETFRSLFGLSGGYSILILLCQYYFVCMC